MNSVRRLTGNLFALLSGEAASSALAFVITILLARRLTDEGFGRLAFVQAMMVYFTLFMDMGLSTFGAREIARNPERVNFFSGAIFSLRLILAVVVAIPFAMAVYFWPLSSEMRWLCWGSALGLFTQALNPEFAFQGKEKMSGISAWRVLVHGFQLLLVLALIIDRDQLRIVPLLRFAAEALTLVILAFWMLRRGLRPQIAWLPWHWRQFLKESMVMAASVVVIKLYYTFDTFMLGVLDRPEAVGWYQAAYKICLLFNGVTVLIQVAFAPYFSKFFLEPERMVKVISKYGLILTFLGGVTVIPLLILNKEIITLVYGASFIHAADSLVFLSLSLYGTFIYSIFMSPMLYSGRQKKYLFLLIVSTCINMILNVALIPFLSQIGAAIAVSISSLCLVMLSAYAYYQEYHDKNLLYIIAKIVLLSFSGYFCVHFLVGNPWMGSILFIALFSIIVILMNRDTIATVVDTFFAAGKKKDISL